VKYTIEKNIIATHWAGVDEGELVYGREKMDK